MTTTFVLWLMLQNQVQLIPGFREQANCQEVGAWYQQEAKRSGRELQFKCGPGPDVAMVQFPLPFNFGRR